MALDRKIAILAPGSEAVLGGVIVPKPASGKQSKKMRKVYSVVLGILIAGAASAQQDPQFTQFMFDRLSVNSGVAGMGSKICATALLRQQWTGFDGAPKTALINVHGPITKISSGIGLTAYYDALGQEKSTIVRLHYAYHRPIGKGILGIGIYAGMTGRALDGDWIAVDPVDADVAIPENGGNATGFDMGAGLYYKAPNFYLGLSSTQLPESELKDVSIQNKRHYYVQGGYDWAIGGNTKYVLQPNLLLKTDASSTQIDVNATFLYNKQVWLGVTYRTEDAIAPMLGYRHELANDKGALMVGYSYDVTTSEIRNYSSGSHEIMLSYCFKIVKKPDLQIYRNPRFL